MLGQDLTTWYSDKFREALSKDAALDSLEGNDGEEAAEGSPLPWQLQGSTWPQYLYSCSYYR